MTARPAPARVSAAPALPPLTPAQRAAIEAVARMVVARELRGEGGRR